MAMRAIVRVSNLLVQGCWCWTVLASAPVSNSDDDRHCAAVVRLGVKNKKVAFDDSVVVVVVVVVELRYSL